MILKLIKGTHVYSPEDLGEKDVLIAGDKIAEIANDIAISGVDVEVIDGKNTICIPGLIDRHVHITGGGGEGGFSSSTPEVQLGSLASKGISTVVGLLGTNDIGRSIKNLLSKAKALREEGINAYILTGGYGYPPNTFTGDVREDIMFFQEVLGLKLAIEDHRSSYITKEEMKRLAAHVRVASMLSGKKGFIHLHMGTGRNHYDTLYEILSETNLPISLFSPTHINRSEDLLEASIEYAHRGGLVDLTSNITLKGSRGRLSPAQALKYLLDKGVAIDQITVSSDANGSMPVFNEAGELKGLEVAGFQPTLDALKELVSERGLSVEEALKPFTVTPAKGLGLYPARGVLQEGSYADIVLMDEEMGIRNMFVNGMQFIKEYELVRKGTFES
ncbi:beta-aspartyl-peptidase [Pseudobacillus badius]|uniref:beta-aspartyl-peptidase n=1 Tax=Bacillus badius TaxID=1455 RepID=UPI0007B4AEDA|nr:beta-aspartyl-peptidase [Bacillus badius]KZN99039.1 beta-aspartyl-peptidase [Bacillus badius]TDW04745.1 beta-aspartyl-dipeptidase (metallo-type) [Bacillus badius]UAT29186.1 beta-aspartyl-peptidase [Bacillus badius]